MITKLKNITFILENCDSITIDGKYVGDFLVDDIKTSFNRTALNCIEKIESAHTFAIEIHKDANKERCSFGQVGCDKHMTFNRLAASDITAIQFELEIEVESLDYNTQIAKSEYYDYYIPWNGENEYFNESQINYISVRGHFYITIAKDKSIEDFFELEEIDDDNFDKFHWAVIDN